MLEEIALQKEIFNVMKREFKYISLLFLLSFIIFKAIFFKEGLATALRLVLSIFWLFVLPGYFIMLYWNEKLEFIERAVIGVALAAGVTGIFSYYFGLIGLNIRYHFALLPLAIIIAGFIFAANKKHSNL